MKSESEYKTEFVRAIKKQGGWGRRIEDQYAVGVLDMVLIVPGLPVLFAEGKVVRGSFFEPTPRQLVEMRRIDAVSYGVAEAVLIGFSPDRVSFSPTTERAQLDSPDVFHCPRPGLTERRMLETYYQWRQSKWPTIEK